MSTKLLPPSPWPTPPTPDAAPRSFTPQLLAFVRTVINAPKLDNIHFRRTNAYVLCTVTLGMTLLAIGVNWCEKSLNIMPALLAITVTVSGTLFWLYKRKEQATYPLFFCTGSLCLFGAYLLLVQSAPDNSSLLWLVIFPPMIMFSMGLRHGTVIFLVFYLFLVLARVTPLAQLARHPLASASRIRLPLAMFGAFVFSWAAEYVRFSTRLALNQALARMEKEALTDTLTGLGNRRDFHNVLAWVMTKAGRDGTPFSLAMIDLDFFKQVNDRHGHAVGDRMLRHVAETLNAGKRSTDFLFRWGGEEFILLMPDLETEQAAIVADRLRKRAQQFPFAEGELVIPYTVSIGLYSGQETRNPHTPVVLADCNLYKAKKAGRNCVICTQADARQESPLH